MGANSTTHGVSLALVGWAEAVTIGGRHRTNGHIGEDGMPRLTWIAFLLCVGCASKRDAMTSLREAFRICDV